MLVQFPGCAAGLGGRLMPEGRAAREALVLRAALCMGGSGLGQP